MKRAVSLFLAACLLLGLAACVQRVDPSSVPGTLDGTVYTNAFFGLRCEAPDGWTYKTRAGLAALNGLSAEEFEQKDYGALLAASGGLIDLHLTSPVGAYATLLITGDSGYNNTLDEKTLAQENAADAKAQLVAAGYANVSVSVGSVRFLGEEKPCLAAEMTDLSIELPFRQITLYLKGTGEYMACLTVTYLDDTTLNQILSCFSKLN